ncbi:MAG: hypothetical protein ABIB43_03340, partial [archaeon]
KNKNTEVVIKHKEKKPLGQRMGSRLMAVVDTVVFAPTMISNAYFSATTTPLEEMLTTGDIPIEGIPEMDMALEPIAYGIAGVGFLISGVTQFFKGKYGVVGNVVAGLSLLTLGATEFYQGYKINSTGLMRVGSRDLSLGVMTFIKTNYSMNKNASHRNN